MADKNPHVYMDVQINRSCAGRMVFESRNATQQILSSSQLVYDIAPFTAENFRALCTTREKGFSPTTGKLLWYKYTYFYEFPNGGTYGGLIATYMAEKTYMVQIFQFSMIFGKLVKGYDTLKDIEEDGRRRLPGKIIYCDQYYGDAGRCKWEFMKDEYDQLRDGEIMEKIGDDILE